MNSFSFFNPTKIIYEEGIINNIGQYVSEYSKNILLVVSNSTYNNGIFHYVINSLSKSNINYDVLDNIKSNPELDKVYEGIEICLKKNCTFLLGVGGGSVIDTVKAISAGATNDNDIWDIICNPSLVKDVIKFGVITTIWGSGSDMTCGAVLTNRELTKKRGFDNKHLFPQFALLDPNIVQTVPDKYICAGIIDIMSHVLERYIEDDLSICLSDKLCLELMKDVYYNANKYLRCNRNALSELMWDSVLAQNGFLMAGRKSNGEWVTHIIAHEFCARYNAIHGEVVGIIFLAWFRYIFNERISFQKRIINFSKEILNFSSENIEDIIVNIERIYKKMGLSTRLSSLGVEKNILQECALSSLRGKKLGKYKKLTYDDVLYILRLCY